MITREPVPVSSLTIALPVFNEEATVTRVIEEIESLMPTSGVRTWEFLVVDDGSTDGSVAAVERLAGTLPQLRIIRHARRRGFAAVQKACYAHAHHDWIWLVPSDGQVPASVLTDLLAAAQHSDVVCGALIDTPESIGRDLVSRLYHTAAESLFGLGLGRFGVCLLVRRTVVQSLEISAQTPVAMTELLVRARAAGAVLTSVQVQKRPRLHGRAEGGSLLGHAPRIFAELVRLRMQLR